MSPTVFLRLTTPEQEASRQSEVFFHGWTRWHWFILLIPLVIWAGGNLWEHWRRKP